MGHIEKGYLADCTLLNPFTHTTIDNNDVQSKAGFSPFHGWSVHGSVEGTLVNGQIGFWQGEFFPTQPRDLFPQ
jgi:dihydroorotase-like cyclic amidohydrolase